MVTVVCAPLTCNEECACLDLVICDQHIFVVIRTSVPESNDSEDREYRSRYKGTRLLGASIGFRTKTVARENQSSSVTCLIQASAFVYGK